jgi:hypothetical protein
MENKEIKKLIRRFRSPEGCAKYVTPFFKKFNWTWFHRLDGLFIPYYEQVLISLLKMKLILLEDNTAIAIETGRLRVVRTKKAFYFIGPVSHADL